MFVMEINGRYFCYSLLKKIVETMSYLAKSAQFKQV